MLCLSVDVAHAMRSNNFKRIKTVEVSGMGFELASSEEVASMLIHRHLNK